MTLKPTDMLEIQSAIDAYERKFPQRPEPSATMALKWRLGKREWAKRLAENPELALDDKRKRKPSLAEQESNRLDWGWEKFRTKWQIGRDSEGGLVHWARKALVVGWWSVFALAVASVFFFGALVGGFK
jgi:hypothetical protein